MASSITRFGCRWIANAVLTCGVLGLSVSMSASGCDAGAAPAHDPDSLSGRVFLLDSADGFTPVAGTTVRIQFSADQTGKRFGFYAGCNHHDGPYEIEGSKLRLLGLGSTDIGCETALSSQDAFLAGFFEAEPTLTLDGDRLAFKAKQATLVFLDRKVKDPDRPLTGRLWTVDTLISGGGASNVPGPAPTIRFESDGSLQAFSGCNDAGGMFTASTSELTLSGLSYTKKACTAPGAASVEAQVKAVLSDGVVQFRIDAARLTLTRGDVGLSAQTE